MISREVSFESKVCLTLKLSLNPSVHGEQAGLVLYLDDDHYCKVVREWIGSLKALAIVSAREEEGKGKAFEGGSPRRESHIFTYGQTRRPSGVFWLCRVRGEVQVTL